ncbi:hypothetical protein HRbin27_00131 [bacterium HR27]|nr:hypothetical protein HRbin27_00131 [bacterium HR27]
MLAGGATLAERLDLAPARQRLTASASRPAPAPVVALAELTVDRAADGRPLRVRGALAVHGVTTWFLVDLASQRVAVRDAYGRGWEGQLAAAPSIFQQLVAQLPTTGPSQERAPTVERAAVDLGGLRVSAARARAAQGEQAELLLRVEDSGLLERIRATRLTLDWQFLALSFLRGEATRQGAVVR